MKTVGNIITKIFKVVQKIVCGVFGGISKVNKGINRFAPRRWRLFIKVAIVLMAIDAISIAYGMLP